MMKLFTNKYPVLQGCLCIQPDNTVDEKSIKVVFDEGKIFKLIGVDQMGVLLQCEKKSVIVNVDIFKLVFTETEIDI
jgi:hypothetical protein